MFKTNDVGSVKILSEELERKIEEVNASMVAARNETEKFTERKSKLEVDVRDLKDTHKKLSEEVDLLRENEKSLLFGLGEVRERINQQKIELKDLEKQALDVKILHEENEKKFIAEREEIAARKADLDSQETVLRTYVKGLDEKEKKLDIYAEHIKKVLDSLKSG